MPMQHCCQRMQDQASWLCPDHPDPADCPDKLISYSEKFNEYGLIVHDGGSSAETIAFCPWCGSKLPASMRERWFSELEARGFEGPFSDDIPVQYESGLWREASE